MIISLDTTMLRIDTIKEISCKTQSMFDTMLSML
jgi:hypothetical protein